MRFAIIDRASGEVVNVVEWEGSIETWQPPDGCDAVASDTANIGDTYLNGKFTAFEGIEPQAPQSLTKRQTVLALYDAGQYDTVVAAIKAAGARAILEWDTATTIERDNALFQQLAPALGLDIDALFASGAKL